jgi:flagellar hook-associated protein 1 FlgK
VATPARGAKSEGGVDIVYRNSAKSTPFTVTEQMTGGRVGGLLEVRDKTIVELHDNINEMALALMDSVNNLHMQGYDASGTKAGAFFDLKAGEANIAEAIQVSERINDDPGRIAAGMTPGASGDNRIAARIGDLQFKPMMGDGRTTLDEFYNSVVGRVGVQTRKVQTSQAAQADIIKQLGNIRESISGVSLDEETTKLIEYQKAFDASARLIRTVDEMYDTILNIKR